MDKVFTPLLYKNLENYLDNALNHHKNEEHIKGVCDMLLCLQEVKLFCTQKKCEFHWKKIKFLGVDVSWEGFEMDNKKITDIVNWQPPTTSGLGSTLSRRPSRPSNCRSVRPPSWCTQIPISSP